jgi:hypothetical protein
MAVYTVHQPPLKKYESSPDPDRFVFVRDGFSFWAFLLGPLWMLWHRMWLVLLGYAAVAVALETGLRFANVSAGTRLFAGLAFAILVGIEAGTLRRFTLRRWKNIGLIVADDRDGAERRFFDSWVRSEALPPSSPARSSLLPATATPRMSPGGPDVIGLFPQPGAPR